MSGLIARAHPLRARSAFPSQRSTSQSASIRLPIAALANSRCAAVLALVSLSMTAARSSVAMQASSSATSISGVRSTHSRMHSLIAEEVSCSQEVEPGTTCWIAASQGFSIKATQGGVPCSKVFCLTSTRVSAATSAIVRVYLDRDSEKSSNFITTIPSPRQRNNPKTMLDGQNTGRLHSRIWGSTRSTQHKLVGPRWPSLGVVRTDFTAGATA